MQLLQMATAKARHRHSNYDKVSKAFTENIRHNMEIENRPGRSEDFKQRYKYNLPIEDEDTPTLILDLLEKSQMLQNYRIWADEADGSDLYEMAFRPKAEAILHS